jgi:hypothetical protein
VIWLRAQQPKSAVTAELESIFAYHYSSTDRLRYWFLLSLGLADNREAVTIKRVQFRVQYVFVQRLPV